DRSRDVRHSVGPSGKHLKPPHCLELTSRTPSRQRSCVTATTDRTYDRKRSVRTLLPRVLQAGGRPHMIASDPSARCCRGSCKQGAVHIWVPARARPAEPGSLGRDDSHMRDGLATELAFATSVA